MSTLTESARTALQLSLSADPVLWTIVGRSLSVSATACLLASLLPSCLRPCCMLPN